MNNLVKILKWLWKNLLSFLGHTAGAAIILFALTAGKAAKDQTTLGYFWAHPGELISPAVVTLLLIMVVSLIAMVIRQKNTLANFGVRLFSKHDSLEVKKRDWGLLKDDLERASGEHSPIWILGATGKETFSAATSPLFDCLQEYKGDIKVLLIRPNSFAFNNRCQGLGLADQRYLDEILDSIDYCKQLHAKGKSIELTLYDSLPIWKMVMTTRVLWVQYYHDRKHVDDTPMYSFEYGGHDATLFEGFRTVFRKRWALDNSKKVDLGAFVRSQWQATC